VVATFQGKPTSLDVLDSIGDRTQLDLPPNSELRICNYRTHTLVTLRGPLRASISIAGVTAERGNAIIGPTCATPAVSIFQNGIVTRGIALQR
jgi:hypothetical protein